MENKIEVKHLTKKYPQFEIKDLSIGIPKGFVTGFIGRNGAGKSTVISAILSLIHAEGDVLVDNAPTHSYDYLPQVGVVMDPEILGADWKMTDVNAAMKIGYRNWDENLFYEYLERFAIHRNLKVKECSKGMKIKLLLATALAHHPNTLILDEPTSGLDPMMRDEFVGIIQEFMEKEGHTVLFSTHITQDLEAIADYIIHIDNGQLIKAMAKEDYIDSFVLAHMDTKDFEKVKDTPFLGCKTSTVGSTLLLETSDLSILEVDYEATRPTIDQIMTLYGRKQ